ncbi:MAG: hypothetical protein KF696_11800 [Planctomycetes bacterium]|nr:hypothetical protein [Planctomycetota bacterium]MCW8136972.1 hypothetical protein [Planctomycetota bacterium]
MSDDTLILLIRGAGVAHFGVVFASLFVPRELGWSHDLAKVKPINRQIFTTYAGYILAINALFGLLALFGATWLLERTPLAACVCGFIAAYWGVRVVLQFAYYDRKSAPHGLKHKLAEAMFVTLFAAFTLIFGYATAVNIRGLP